MTTLQSNVTALFNPIRWYRWVMQKPCLSGVKYIGVRFLIQNVLENKSTHKRKQVIEKGRKVCQNRKELKRYEEDG